MLVLLYKDKAANDQHQRTSQRKLTDHQSARRGNSVRTPVEQLPKRVSVTEEANCNLTEPEKELLQWHYQLGDIGMKQVQWLFHQGAIATSMKNKLLQSSAVKLSTAPLYTAC